jgi:hypothetical protein
VVYGANHRAGQLGETGSPAPLTERSIIVNVILLFFQTLSEWASAAAVSTVPIAFQWLTKKINERAILLYFTLAPPLSESELSVVHLLCRKRRAVF